MTAPSPNPRLQRTPLRAPLSRKPLGVGRVSCAPALRTELELGCAVPPQAASGRISRIDRAGAGPGHVGRRLSSRT